MPSEEFPHDQLFDGSAIPIKTHKRADADYGKQNLVFSKGILIVRNPFDAIRANFNRRVVGNTDVVTEETFNKKREFYFILCALDRLNTHRPNWTEQDLNLQIESYTTDVDYCGI